jgi:hypothetical protein
MIVLPRSPAMGAEWSCLLSPFAVLHVLEDKLETIAESPHVWVDMALHPKGLGYNLDGPTPHLSSWPSLEAQIEVSGILGIETEGVDRACWVSFRIRSQPAFYPKVSFEMNST